MDPHRHATLSAARHGGEPDDYYAVHQFMDTTKELCSDNRHRLLHTIWGIRTVALPLFGPVLAPREPPDTREPARTVRTKAVLEFDHVLADFGGRFIPTIGDFVAAIAPDGDESRRFVDIHAPYRDDDDAMRILLSPYYATGRVHALLVTHNTWFLGEILPRLLGARLRLSPPGVPPDELFARMRFEAWMDNGAALPPSAPRRTAVRAVSAVDAANPAPLEAPCRS